MEQATAKHGYSLPGRDSQSWDCSGPPVTAPGLARGAGSHLGPAQRVPEGERLPTKLRRGPQKPGPPPRGEAPFAAGPEGGAEARGRGKAPLSAPPPAAPGLAGAGVGGGAA